ncbi:MAG: hypothetical protein ACRCVW_06110 [Brevinema sp.]
MPINILIIFFFSWIIVPSTDYYAQVFSWHHRNKSSLAVISKQNVVHSNCAFMATETNAFFVTEDIEINSSKYIKKMSVRLTKKKMSSYVVVSLIDTYSDQEIVSKIFYENDTIVLDDMDTVSDRVYLKITIVGNDLEIRSAGVVFANRAIITPKQFIVSPTNLIMERDLLTINFSLTEEAEVYLYIYDKQGTLVTKLSDGRVFAIGDYHYEWDPAIVPPPDSGQYYYLWAKFENLRSAPVELIKHIYMIPN